MVKVFYEPPPYGPGTALNRPSYGVIEAKPQFIQLLSRRPQGMLIAGACAAFAAIAYIPISEYQYYHYFYDGKVLILVGQMVIF